MMGIEYSTVPKTLGAAAQWFVILIMRADFRIPVAAHGIETAQEKTVKNRHFIRISPFINHPSFTRYRIIWPSDKSFKEPGGTELQFIGNRTSPPKGQFGGNSVRCPLVGSIRIVARIIGQQRARFGNQSQTALIIDFLGLFDSKCTIVDFDINIFNV